MKVIKTTDNHKMLVIVNHLHGDEYFGSKVYKYFSDNIDKYTGLKVIFANEEAANKKTRFIDQDLNRSFPGKIDGNHEEKLAL